MPRFGPKKRECQSCRNWNIDERRGEGAECRAFPPFLTEYSDIGIWPITHKIIGVEDLRSMNHGRDNTSGTPYWGTSKR